MMRFQRKLWANSMLVPANEPIELANMISLILNYDAIRRKLAKMQGEYLLIDNYEAELPSKKL